jgi:hypothetical protein
MLCIGYGLIWDSSQSQLPDFASLHPGYEESDQPWAEASVWPEVVRWRCSASRAFGPGPRM